MGLTIFYLASKCGATCVDFGDVIETESTEVGDYPESGYRVQFCFDCTTPTSSAKTIEVLTLGGDSEQFEFKPYVYPGCSSDFTFSGGMPDLPEDTKSFCDCNGELTPPNCYYENLNLFFAPDSEGDFEATFKFKYDGVEGPEVTARGTGTPLEKRFAINPESMDFGQVPILRPETCQWKLFKVYLTEEVPESISLAVTYVGDDDNFTFHAMPATSEYYWPVSSGRPSSPIALTSTQKEVRFYVSYDPDGEEDEHEAAYTFKETTTNQEKTLLCEGEGITEGPKIALIPEKVALNTWRGVIKDMCGVKYKIEIKNIGDADLIISKPVHLNPWANQWKWLQEAGDKPVSNDLPSLPQTVTAGSTISWHLQFCPNEFGRYWGEWTFYSNAINKNPVMLTALGTCWPAVGMGCTPGEDPDRDVSCEEAICSQFPVAHAGKCVKQVLPYGYICRCSVCGTKCRNAKPTDENVGAASLDIEDEDINIV